MFLNKSLLQCLSTQDGLQEYRSILMLGITLRWTSNVNTPICAHSTYFKFTLFEGGNYSRSSKGAGFWRFWSDSKKYGIGFWKVFRKTEKRKFQNTNHSTKHALKSGVKTEHLLLARNILKVEQSAQVSSFPEIVGNDIPITTGNFWRCKLEFLLKKKSPKSLDYLAQYRLTSLVVATACCI